MTTRQERVAEIRAELERLLAKPNPTPQDVARAAQLRAECNAVLTHDPDAPRGQPITINKPQP